MSVEIGRVDPSVASPQGGVARGAPKSEDREPRPDHQGGDDAAPARRSDDAREVLKRLAEDNLHLHSRLSIDLDKEAGAFVYRILDSRSGEVVRQFPAEKVLELMRYLGQEHGLVVDRKV
jgi:uncharacterized FlaG/YvyC family protein